MNTAIFGAGQAGMMAKQWLPSCYKVCCFIDNDVNKHTEKIDGLPIVSFSEISAYQIEVIVVAIIRKQARISILKQIQDSGFSGTILDTSSVRNLQDIRLASLRLIANMIQERNVPGECAELGVYQGEFAKEINQLFPDRKLYLFDTFCGFDTRDTQIESDKTNVKQFRDFSDTSVESVMKRMPHPKQVISNKGYFPETIPSQEIRYAFVSLDPDLYEPVKQGLQYFWPRLNEGGVILIHDYTSLQFTGVKKAVDAFCLEHNIFVIPLMDMHGSAILLKQGG